MRVCRHLMSMASQHLGRDRLNQPTADREERTQDPLLTLDEVSERTHMPVTTLRYKRHMGELPFLFKLGRRLVAYRSELDNWIDAQREASRRV